ncbi:cytochrome b5 [Boletus reticuloceps]|uniref:Cytochrome b5 n=1 Tax=Boletus reticuloceps TaxID=495285 RepID=A0A8I2YTP9_9AGAM|nr:cytochrome b5 [Boletus reticuloceps]KAG6378385.1 cytochrome b5 [Boletus reticuloceps]
MSWIWNPSGNAPKPQPTEEMVPDPGDPNRMVSKKAANQPFLAYHGYRRKKEELHQAWLQRKKEREEKLARGEKVGPEERDPTAEEEVGLLGLLKFIVYLLVIVTLAGKFFTGSFLWEYEGKWARLKSYWPESSGRLFSESYLATFDGTDPSKPIYIAIDGDVFDVSSSRHTYGPGGSYYSMAGIDAARSFATGCFATHRTHDLRGLTDQELKGIENWKRFFTDHKAYFKVGRVLHHPIDPQSPIPEHCDPKKEEGAQPKKGSDDSGKPPVQPDPSTHEEPKHKEL